MSSLPDSKVQHHAGKLGQDQHIPDYGLRRPLAMRPTVKTCLLQDGSLQRLARLTETELEDYLAPRHVVDILLEFPSVKPPLHKLLRSLRPLQPRLYSISSSPLENPRHVQAGSCAHIKHQAYSMSKASHQCTGKVSLSWSAIV